MLQFYLIYLFLNLNQFLLNEAKTKRDTRHDSRGAREGILITLKHFILNVRKRISRTKNEIAVPASLHSIRELSAKEKNRRRIEEQREAQHFEYVKRSGSLKHAEIRPQRSAYQGIRYGLYQSKFAKSYRG